MGERESEDQRAENAFIWVQSQRGDDRRDHNTRLHFFLGFLFRHPQFAFTHCATFKYMELEWFNLITNCIGVAAYLVEATDFEVFVFLAAEYETPKNSLNQISLWDGIIPSKEIAKFEIHTSSKYRFVDQGSNLRGKEFNLTLHWHVMFADKLVMSGYPLPQEYR